MVTVLPSNGAIYACFRLHPQKLCPSQVRSCLPRERRISVIFACQSRSQPFHGESFGGCNTLHEKEFPIQGQLLDYQAEWSAIPDYPEAVEAMCWTYVASCLVERAWRFGLPALIASFSDNLVPVALNSFIGQAVVFVGGPVVGALLDSRPRVFAFVFLSSMQTVSILISSAVVIHIINKGVMFGTSTLSILLQPWFILLVAASSVDRITGIATGVAFERDWVVLLAGQTRTIALANANAMLRRVDLICEIVGPVLFGFALSNYSPSTCVLISSAIAVVSLPVLILLAHRTYNFSKGALNRPNELMFKKNQKVSGLGTFTHGWLEYLKQPILPASIAYVLLSFNAVLAPSGLMTSFLTQRGLNPSVAGSYRGLCALMGFLATYIGSTLIGRFGTLKAGAISLTYQASLLCLAVLLYWILSRLGHWAYDMIIAQIFQTAVLPCQANLLSSTEMSLASFAELIMLAVAIISSDISHFGALACLSMMSVAGAALLYWCWLTNCATKALFEG